MTSLFCWRKLQISGLLIIHHICCARYHRMVSFSSGFWAAHPCFENPSVYCASSFSSPSLSFHSSDMWAEQIWNKDWSMSSTHAAWVLRRGAEGWEMPHVCHSLCPLPPFLKHSTHNNNKPLKVCLSIRYSTACSNTSATKLSTEMSYSLLSDLHVPKCMQGCALTEKCLFKGLVTWLNLVS